MSGFSTEWLALREPADLEARDETLAQRFCEMAGAARIVDLGGGSGSTMSALAGMASPDAAWQIVDHDPALLAAAAGRFPHARTQRADLASDLEAAIGDAQAITASALIDLVSAAWIDRFAEAAQGRIVYAALSYDGAETWSPPMVEDAEVLGAFHRHQWGDKGFGPALGPAGGARLAEALAANGWRVETAPSPWRLTAPRGSALMAALSEGIAGAALEMGADEAASLRWRAARQQAQGCVVGHLDLLATPL